MALKGFATEGEMAPEIALDGQRSAEFVFDSLVSEAVSDLHGDGSGKSGGAKSSDQAA